MSESSSVQQSIAGTKVVLGISGGVAAYKSAFLASRLVQHGATVQVVMTDAAKPFVGAATFAALTGRPVADQLFDHRYPLGAHIELARFAHLLLVAPATADLIAKMAHGVGNDLLSTLYLAYSGPVLIAPAMNATMWEHMAVQRNVQQVIDDGVQLVGPESGWLSCRDQGSGRMSEPQAILEQVNQLVQGLRPPDHSPPDHSP